MGSSLTITERIARGRTAIARGRVEGRDTRDWEAHLARLEALAAGEGPTRPLELCPPATANAPMRWPTTKALLKFWATCPAVPDRWPKGQWGVGPQPAR